MPNIILDNGPPNAQTRHVDNIHSRKGKKFGE